MAQVYRASAGRRVVAIKQLHPKLRSEPEYASAFAREAQLGSALSHPNIVAVYEKGESEDLPYFAMEYVDGRSLRRILQQISASGQLPPCNVVLSLLAQVCDALAYAQRTVQLVHRDLSPSNVLVDRRGRAKIIDFGISKADDDGLTPYAGQVFGSLHYLAPETVEQRPLDGRADVWSAAVVGWELLTGRHLFDGDDQHVHAQILRADIPPPSTFNPMCTPAIDRLFLRALERDRERRFQSAAELWSAIFEAGRELAAPCDGKAVQTWLAALFGEPAPDLHPRRVSWWLFACAAAAAAGFAAAATF